MQASWGRFQMQIFGLHYLRLRIYLKQSGLIELEQIKHPSEGGKVNKNYAMVTRNAKLSPASPHESNYASAPTYGL